MTFGALAAWQAWLLVLGAGLAAWWLFRMKVRPPRLAVPSLLLWRRVLDDRSAPSWWDRVRRAVSLAVTVLVAASLGMAVARPAPRAATGTEGRLLIVLDASWSMRARTADGQTRWARAVAGARALAQAAGGDVALATTADGLVEGPTADSALIATALDRLEPSGGEAAAWPRVEGVAVTHFFTDGALLRPVEPGTIVHSVFSPAPNIAINAFSARPGTSSAAGPSAYLEIANYADEPQRVHVTVTRAATVIVDRWMDLGPAGVAHEVLPLDATGGGTLRARVSAEANALDVDDEAVAWLAGGDPISVAVVTPEPDAWSSLFAGDPTVRASVVSPSGYEGAAADVFIFDRWAPTNAPGRPALYLAPPAVGWLARPVESEVTPAWGTSDWHPILEGVDPFTLDIARAWRYEGPSLQPVAESARGTPLVSLLEAPDARGVLVAFSPAESNLTSAQAFPVLVGNVLDWLARPAAGDPRAPGPVDLPASTTRVTSPDGASVPLVRAGDRVLATLRAPGLYLVEAGGARSVIGVNIGNPAIANLSRTTLEPDVAAARVPAGVHRAWWFYLAGLAFVLVAAEWWTWQRRITV